MVTKLEDYGDTEIYWSQNIISFNMQKKKCYLPGKKKLNVIVQFYLVKYQQISNILVMYYTDAYLTKAKEKTRYDTGEHTVTLEYRSHHWETFQILPA